MKSFILKEKLFLQNDRLIVAVSGGIDSIVLCGLLYLAGYKFEIAHCNFQLRGEESERDEKFVERLSEKYNTRLHLRKFDTTGLAVSEKMSIQETARKIRYEWFEELTKSPQVKTGGKVLLLTAHHLDDDIETMIFHFFQGSGINGLRGIPAKRDFIVRPLLFATRKEIEEFASANMLEWVEDSSNSTTKYTRNFIRHELVPITEKVIPNIKQNLAFNLSRFKDTAILFEQAMAIHRNRLLLEKENQWMIPVEKLRLSEPVSTVLYELIKPFGFQSGQLNDAVRLMDSDTGKWIVSSTHRLLKNRNWLIISDMEADSFSTVVIEAGEKEIIFSGGKMEIDYSDDIVVPGSEQNTAQLDLKEISFPLILRRWKTGDYFYPLGMKKKKKLSRFFIDLKLSKTQKEKVLVVESNKRILWIVGHRIDDRFKITSATKRSLRLHLK